MLLASVEGYFSVTDFGYMSFVIKMLCKLERFGYTYDKALFA